MSGNKEVQCLSSPSFCLPSYLDLVFWIFLPSSCFPLFCLPSYCPPVSLHLISFFMFPIHVFLTITFYYLFILFTITPSSCLRSHCLALFSFPLIFYLFLIIPSSYPVILSLPMFFNQCVLNVVQSFFDFWCGWVAKLDYIIIFLRILLLIYPSYCKNLIPQQGTREHSNPPPLKKIGLLIPKIKKMSPNPSKEEIVLKYIKLN